MKSKAIFKFLEKSKVFMASVNNEVGAKSINKAFDLIIENIKLRDKYITKLEEQIETLKSHNESLKESYDKLFDIANRAIETNLYARVAKWNKGN